MITILTILIIESSARGQYLMKSFNDGEAMSAQVH